MDNLGGEKQKTITGVFVCFLFRLSLKKTPTMKNNELSNNENSCRPGCWFSFFN